jgi:processive 1,2-diacylglycerol beta-glucosyltransferase
MFNKVLILSATVGNGHTRAAQSLEKAFQLRRIASEIRHEDVLNFTNPVFRRLYSNAYIDFVNNAPDFLGWMYDQLDEPWKNEKRRLFFDKLNTQRFVKMVREYQPDWIVCTHFLPSEIISDLKAKGKLDSRQAIVVTDFDMHAMWLCRNYEHYFVALEETKEFLQTLGFDSEKITVSGIPIDPVFAENKDKLAMRKKLELDGNTPTIILSAGGFGVGSIEVLLKSLETIKQPVQVLAMCGRNEELKNKLTQYSAKEYFRVVPVGYTTEMDDYMSASDLVVGKPGGLTTCEALAKGLVFVVVNPIPGQEERNSDHLLENWTAIRCNNMATIGYKIERLLNNQQKLSAMRENALRMARPNAAFVIADKLLEIST